SGALHGLRAHQHRRDHRREAGLDGLPHRQVEHPELEHRAVAGQVVEARPGGLGPALGVEQAQARAQFEVVPDVLGDGLLADLAQDDVVVLAARGGALGHEVRQGLAGRLELGGGRRHAHLGGLDLFGEGLGAVQQGPLLLGSGGRDLLAQALLLGAERLEGLEGAAVLGVRGQERVDGLGGGAALALAVAVAVRVLSQCTQIDHAHQVTGLGAGASRPYRGRVAVEMSEKDFEAAVADALDEVPQELLAMLDNVVILVEEEPEGPDKDLLGLYHGTALTDRGWEYGGVLPDTITIYRGPTLRMCSSVEEVIEEVAITVVHEIAHHFGIEEHRLHELGWG